MPHTGVDVIFTEPGESGSRTCLVCSTPMKVDRNALGPTSFATALAGKRVLHDRWACPHAEEEWHLMAYELARSIPLERSPTLAAIRQLDLERLLESNLPGS